MRSDSNDSYQQNQIRMHLSILKKKPLRIDLSPQINTEFHHQSLTEIERVNKRLNFQNTTSHTHKHDEKFAKQNVYLPQDEH